MGNAESRSTVSLTGDLRPLSPDQVEQGVRRRHDGSAAQTVAVHLRPHARFDDEDEHDAHHHGDEGGPQVVGDGEDTHPAARLGLHRRQARHQTGPEQRTRTQQGQGLVHKN